MSVHAGVLDCDLDSFGYTILHFKGFFFYIFSVTHVITSCNKNGMCPRTLKYLRGVLQGKWIVNMECK